MLLHCLLSFSLTIILLSSSSWFLYPEMFVSVCLQDFLFIIDFKQFDYDVPRSSFFHVSCLGFNELLWFAHYGFHGIGKMFWSLFLQIFFSVLLLFSESSNYCTYISSLEVISQLKDALPFYSSLCVLFG